MLSLYGQALLKRANHSALTQFKPPALPQRIYSQRVMPDKAHYQRYCQVVNWHQDEQVHPCYIQIIALELQLQCLLDKKSPFAAMGLVHIDTQITVKHELLFAQPVDLRVRFQSVRAHHRGWLVTVSIQAFQNDRCVAEAQSGYLAKVRAAHVGKQSKSGDGPSVHGDVIGELTADAGIGRRYARVSGDFNPIHLSSLSAKLFGFPSAIAHGMWSLAEAVSNIVDEQHSHGAPHIVTRLRCQFYKPMLLPTTAEVVFDKHGDDHEFGVVNNDTVHVAGTIGLTE